MNRKHKKLIEKKGNEGEELFQQWLDEMKLGYLYVRQDKDRFASLFKGQVKRPDFLVLIDSIGLIAVDVKNKALSRGEYTLGIDNEIKPVLNFERLFRLPVWYAYCNKRNNTWYWISALKAINSGIGNIRTNVKDKKPFLAIKLSEFVEIKQNEDIGRLYSQRMGSFEPIIQEVFNEQK